MNAKELFSKAIDFDRVPRAPVWIMRQAGRYLSDYRKIREKYDFLSMCKTPEIAAEVSLQPLKIINTDAVILFSDILTAIEPMGIDLEFSEEGPVIRNPVRTEDSVKRLRNFEPAESLDYVEKAIGLIRSELFEKNIPLLGFSGAPFTLATYMIEGGASRNLNRTKRMLHSAPDIVKAMLDKLTDQMITYLRMQIGAGADFVQIFDTWAGTLSREDYADFAFPYEKKLISALHGSHDTKVILFVKGSSHLLDLMQDTGADVISLDWRCDLKGVSSLLSGTAIQGNLDPAVLYGKHEVIEKGIMRVFEECGRRTGHVFNLGHGILPDVPEENVRYFIETVKSYSRRYYQ